MGGWRGGGSSGDRGGRGYGGGGRDRLPRRAGQGHPRPACAGGGRLSGALGEGESGRARARARSRTGRGTRPPGGRPGAGRRAGPSPAPLPRARRHAERRVSRGRQGREVAGAVDGGRARKIAWQRRPLRGATGWGRRGGGERGGSGVPCRLRPLGERRGPGAGRVIGRPRLPGRGRRASTSAMDAPAGDGGPGRVPGRTGAAPPQSGALSGRGPPGMGEGSGGGRAVHGLGEDDGRRAGPARHRRYPLRGAGSQPVADPRGPGGDVPLRGGAGSVALLGGGTGTSAGRALPPPGPLGLRCGGVRGGGCGRRRGRDERLERKGGPLFPGRGCWLGGPVGRQVGGERGCAVLGDVSPPLLLCTLSNGVASGGPRAVPGSVGAGGRGGGGLLDAAAPSVGRRRGGRARYDGGGGLFAEFFRHGALGDVEVVEAEVLRRGAGGSTTEGPHFETRSAGHVECCALVSHREPLFG